MNQPAQPHNLASQTQPSPRPANKYDQLLQETCRAIVTAVAEALDHDIPGHVTRLGLDSGIEYGRQLVIDAAGSDGLLNLCRLTVLNPTLDATGEVIRIEYEHDKQTKFGSERSYSLQSIRRKNNDFVLVENFLADAPEHVREADFRPILSNSYAEETVLGTLRQWVQFRQWQIQHG
jgi:hypothetical protein